MHFQMSGGASVPSLVPAQGVPTPTPALVPPKPKPSGKKRLLGWLLFLALAAVGIERGVHAYRQSVAAPTAAAAVVRATTVKSGLIERTLRLTGTTGAEKFASLISPQLRGNRGAGGGRDGNLRQSSNSGSGGLSIRSNSGGGGGGGVQGGGNSGGGSSDSSGSSVASTGPSVASTNGQQTAMGSQAFRSATSRISRAPSTSSSPSGASPSASSTSSSPSSNTNLGSTSNQLIGSGTGGSGGGGGGGGGMSEFNLVLQDAAKPGSKVRKGEVVAEFDRQYMMTRLDDYRASVAQIEASFRKMQAEVSVSRESHAQKIATAKAAFGKAQLDLKTIPVLGAIEAEKTRLAAEETEAQYKQLLAEVKFVEIGYASQLKNAELELQQAKVELRRAEANADRMLIKAPIDGLAVMQTMIRGSEFAQIQAGDQLWPGMMFMQIVDPSSMIINATVNQVDVDNLRIGQQAKVRFDAYPDLEVPAHVAAIGAMTRAGGMRASYVKEIPVILKIDKMDLRIIPDLSVSIDVVLQTEEAQTVAPLSAVFRDAPDATPYTYLKNGDKWERRDVELGLTSNTQIVIRSGLKPGDVVAEDSPPVTGKEQS